MQTSIEIIEEIKSDASGIQRKFLTLPGPGEDIGKKQQRSIDVAQNGLLEWRSYELEQLEKAFSKVS